MLNLLLLSFGYAAVYWVTGRRILAVVVLHAVATATGELISGPTSLAAGTVGKLVMTAVAVLVLVHGASSLPMGVSASVESAS